MFTSSSFLSYCIETPFLRMRPVSSLQSYEQPNRERTKHSKNQKPESIYLCARSTSQLRVYMYHVAVLLCGCFLLLHILSSYPLFLFPSCLSIYLLFLCIFFFSRTIPWYEGKDRFFLVSVLLHLLFIVLQHASMSSLSLRMRELLYMQPIASRW